MAKQKIDLKTPDAFHTTSDKIFHLIEEHAKTVIGVVALGVVLSLVSIGYAYVGHRREASAAEALFTPEAALKKAEASVREGRDAEATHVPTAAEKKQPRKMPKSFDEDFGALVTNVDAQIKAHGTTRVALVAALNLTYFLVREKRAEQALEILGHVTYRPSSSDILAGFYEMHRGLALIETNKFKEAVEAYRAVLAEKRLAALHPEASLKLGVAAELGGDAAAARDAYEKTGRDFPGSEAATSAQNFLRALSLKAKKG